MAPNKSTKKAETRIHEILDIAENLFIEKGYEHTTINDILEATGFAKGSLYYYFKSKEDVLDGIIRRQGDENLEAVRRIVQISELNAYAKLLQAVMSLSPQDERQRILTEDLERSSNGQMFLKSLNDIVQRLAPEIKIIIEQGISEGLFATPYPLESAEILLAAAHALFDNASLVWTEAEANTRIIAFITAMERVLGATQGSLIELFQSSFIRGD